MSQLLDITCNKADVVKLNITNQQGQIFGSIYESGGVIVFDGYTGGTGQGSIGPTGSTGATGAQGPTGMISSVGSYIGDYIVWNGSSWVSGGTGIHIGLNSGFTGQAVTAVAIGIRSAYLNQGSNSVAIGTFSGNTSQSSNAVAIGSRAGNSSQSSNAVALGAFAGQLNQGNFSVALGTSAGQTSQGNYSVAIGSLAGQTGQGNYSVAIGYLAGVTGQKDNTIILNATGAPLMGNPSSNVGCLFMAPIRQDNTIPGYLAYDTQFKEVVYNTSTIPSETVNNLEGNYTVQSIIPNSTSINQKYLVSNDGIEQTANFAWNSLRVGNNSYIPFFTKNNTPYPPNSITADSPSWSIYPSSPAGSNVGICKSIVSSPFSPIVYIAIYNITGDSTTVIYTFNIETNTYGQFGIVKGEVKCMLWDNNLLYIGGSFTTVEGLYNFGSSVASNNVAYIDLSNNNAYPMMTSGLDSTVYCLAKWNGFIAIGGSFTTDSSGSGNFYQKIALYDKTGDAFKNIGQTSSSTINDYGFDNDVYSLAVIPETNTLVIGGKFEKQYWTGFDSNHTYICKYELLQGFSRVGDGSLSGGSVYSLLADQEGGRLYIGGEFGTNNGAKFVALSINKLDTTFYNLNSQVEIILGSNMVKDEIGGFIWIFNTNTENVYKYNPVVSSSEGYENFSIISNLSGASFGCYSWFDKAIHFGINSGDSYYRYYCDQRVKIKQVEGNIIQGTDGSIYNVVVLPKKGSSVMIIKGGITTPGKWYAYGASPGVYYEWEDGQITQPGPAYATALLTTTLIAPTSTEISWDELKGQNINLTAYNSGRIAVNQKGLYKMSYNSQISNSSPTTNAIYFWFIVNGNKYQKSVRVENISGNTASSTTNELFVELDIGDFVGLYVESPSGTIDIPSIPATSTIPMIPAIPGIIFNIELVKPVREYYV